ncbi:MAG: EAL domain-containing protein, partial [Syntrophomonadaceae bacterium]|nr:EAL domain-containing protein [Syntrophomonadaceae bacterium]
LAIMESATMMLKTMDKGAYLDIDRQTADTLYRRLSVESALQYAIRHRTLNVYYQPICSVQTGKIVGAEALVRLYDTRLGNIPPEEFIIVAEQMGMIKEVGEVVIEITSKFVADNRLWERNVGMMHINLSTLQCMEYKLSEHILATFEHYGVPADMFSFEITESAAIASEAQLLNTMNELIPHGVKFAMDDYGSGYSNSSTIIRFPFHAIKIDKSMLWGSTGSEKARVIYCNTVNMIRQMNLQVISEGVETSEQAELLKRLGVDYVQGFYFSRPLPSEKFLQYLAEQNSEA